jgi:uncharacterized membrane protein YbhN (UPF0104 family)
MTTVSIPAVAIMLAIKVALFLLNALQLKVQIDGTGLNMTYAQCFGVSRITQFTNLVVPVAGGAPVKALYLNKVHGLSYTTFVALMTASNLVKLLVGSLYALLLLLPLGAHGRGPISLAGALLVAALLFLLLMHRVPGRALAFWPWAARLAAEWRVLRSNGRLLGRLTLLSILVFLLATLDVYASFRAFAVPASPAACGAITAFSSLSAIPNLVPGNLGVRELLFVTISDLYGTGLNASLHAVALNRFAGMLITLLLAIGLTPRPSSRPKTTGREP